LSALPSLAKDIDQFEKRIDPRGKTYYWLAGEVIEEVAEIELESIEGLKLKMSRPDMEWFQAIPTDVQAIRQNYITVTPLQYNLTCVLGISALQNRKFYPGHSAS
jgi:5'-nucleotidase